MGKKGTSFRAERFKTPLFSTLVLLAGLVGEARSGVTAAEAVRFADRAIAALLDALNAGRSWQWPSELKKPDFDPLRGRDDCKKLLAELETRHKAKAAKNWILQPPALDDSVGV